MSQTSIRRFESDRFLAPFHPSFFTWLVDRTGAGLRLLLRTSGLAALVSLPYRIPFLISSLILYVSSFFSLSLAAILASALGLTAMVL
jgi:hypothetical protein